MLRFDAIVVGGGPAGSSCARELVRLGFDTLVLDRAVFPRDKTCAGWITPAVPQTLGLSLNDYAKEHTLQPIHGFRIAAAGERGVDIDYAREISFAIRRCEFDHYLLQRSGARLELGTPLRSLRRDASRWVLNEEFTAPVLVGAGGHFCPIARHLGPVSETLEPVVKAREIEFELKPDERESLGAQLDRPELYFERDLTGYGWIVRKQGYVNIGLGRQSSESLNTELDRFLTDLVSMGRLSARPQGRFRGHAYLLCGQSPRRPSHTGALLIGDALGLASVRSGEGILPAIESGILAAHAIARARSDYSQQRLAVYDQALRARFGAPSSTNPHAWLPDTVRRPLATFLLRQPWFARHVVIDRWFVPHARPSLATG